MKYRKIHFKNQEWNYIITSTKVILKNPCNKKNIIKQENFLRTLGWTSEDIFPTEDDFWDHHSISITPSMIKEYLVKTAQD